MVAKIPFYSRYHPAQLSGLPLCRLTFAVAYRGTNIAQLKLVAQGDFHGPHSLYRSFYPVPHFRCWRSDITVQPDRGGPSLPDRYADLLNLALI